MDKRPKSREETSKEDGGRAKRYRTAPIHDRTARARTFWRAFASFPASGLIAAESDCEVRPICQGAAMLCQPCLLRHCSAENGTTATGERLMLSRSFPENDWKTKSGQF